ncbi:MAG: putative toxin-antitoxin system toxin component, PIN family [Alphaproteobacteria bacterium]|nr:putative toxin-antitoxin system toxin component, PIN family [Alphaproteobacteria bacterium]
MLSLAVVRLVLDTSVFISAVRNAEGAPRAVLRLALQGDVRPVFGNALFSGYEAVLSRDALFASAPIDAAARGALFDALLSVSDWANIYFLWRPNLPDDGDNHLIELALAAGAKTIITKNVRDFRGAELRFPGLSIRTAAEYLQERKQP